jgi:DUF438 domain-containing protein
MNKPKFKTGDWCFCEFKLQQIKEMENDKIISVSDGMFRLTSSDLSDRCFPLDITIKNISDMVAYWSAEFHKLNNNNINHPDLNRELITRWVELCENNDNDEKMKELEEKLSNFGRLVIQKVNNLSLEHVDGVRLFKR